MNKRLTADDRHAIDLLLERPDGSGDKPLVNMVFAHPVRGKFEQRLATAERILDLLQAMPADEPPADLVSRTLDRIDADRLAPRSTLSPSNQTSRNASRPA